MLVGRHSRHAHQGKRGFQVWRAQRYGNSQKRLQNFPPSTFLFGSWEASPLGRCSHSKFLESKKTNHRPTWWPSWFRPQGPTSSDMDSGFGSWGQWVARVENGGSNVSAKKDVCFTSARIPRTLCARPIVRFTFRSSATGPRELSMETMRTKSSWERCGLFWRRWNPMPREATTRWKAQKVPYQRMGPTASWKLFANVC